MSKPLDEPQDLSAPREPARPTVWAVGGGKGGVGKSLLSSSLAIAFSRQGHRCGLIDLDLGAANAHTLLGMQSPKRTLSDFFERRVERLGDVLVPTPFPGLQLVGGTRASLDLANPKYSQKERLLRQIRALDLDHVLLDLSAGCAFNVLDFFLAAERRIAVLIPEATSLENTQHFLKTAFFRSLRPIARQEPLRAAIAEALARPERPVHSARELVEAVGEIEPEAGARLAARAAEFAPMLVINQVARDTPADAASQIALACRHYLAASVRERRRLPHDERVRRALARGRHPVEAEPGSPFSIEVLALAEGLLADRPTERLARPPRRRDQARLASLLPPPGATEPGTYLRRCRERLGLSLADVCRRTRIRSLGRIEEERYDELPDERYVGAFVRQYAETLGIRDPDTLTRRYLDRFRSARSA